MQTGLEEAVSRTSVYSQRKAKHGTCEVGLRVKSPVRQQCQAATLPFKSIGTQPMALSLLVASAAATAQILPINKHTAMPLGASLLAFNHLLLSVWPPSPDSVPLPGSKIENTIQEMKVPTNWGSVV